MEPIKISSLQENIHNFVLRNQKEYNPDLNDELSEVEQKKLMEAFGVKDIKELQDAGLDTFKTETKAEATKSEAQTAIEKSEAESTEPQEATTEESAEESGNNINPESDNEVSEEHTEEKSLAEPILEEDVEVSGQTVKKKVFNIRQYGSGAEKLFSFMNAGELMNDGSALGGIAAMNNGFDAEAEYYEMNGDSIDDEIVADKLTAVDSKRDDLNDLAIEYIRQNQSAIQDELKQGKVEEITLDNGEKIVLIPSYRLKTNNNSQDSVTDYMGENTDDADQDVIKEKQDDISKLIAGAVVAVEVASDKWQVLGKLDFGYQDDTDFSMFANYQDKTKKGFDYSISGAAGLTTNKEGTEVRYGATFDIAKNDFKANATLYGTTEKTLDNERDWSLDITGDISYKNAKLGGFCEMDEVSKYWGASTGYHGEMETDIGLTFGGKVEAEVGNISFDKDAIGVSVPSIINTRVLGTGYLKFKADDLNLRAGGMFRGDWSYSPEETENKWTNSLAGSVYANFSKGRYSIGTIINFIQNDVIPSVQATINDVILPGFGITVGYTGPTNYEKQIGSKGTFVVGLKKGLGF